MHDSYTKDCRRVVLDSGRPLKVSCTFSLCLGSKA